MKSKVALFLVIAMIIMSFTACGNKSSSTNGSDKSSNKSKGTLLVGIESDPTTYNEDAKTDDYAYYIDQNIFNRLVKIDYNNSILPDLAETWKISDDGLTYTFNLAKGVKWHDGKPFTSADVKYTYDQIINNKGVSVDSLKSIKEITCPDDNTVVLKLKQPDGALLGHLSWDGVFILPKHIYDGTDWMTNPANNTPIGTGPFKFVKHDKGVSINLQANKDYFKGAPGVENLVYKIIPDSNTAVQSFYNGELDILGISAPLAEVAKFQNTSGVKVVKKPLVSRIYAAFNLRNQYLKNPDIRQAIALGIDRQEIVDKATKGVFQAAKGFYSPAVKWAYNDKDVLPDKDTSKAKELLEKAGLKPDKDGNYLSLELIVFKADPFPDIATVIKEDLKQIGINVKINIVEDAAWTQKVLDEKNFDFSMLAGYQGPDPGALAGRVSSNGFLQFMGYSNPQVDKLFEEAAVLTKQDERGQKYKEIQKILSQDLPIVPLAEWENVCVMKDYIKGHPADDGIGKEGTDEYSLVTINK